MRIDSVVIERADGPLYCGLLFYEHEAASQYVPWTIDLENPAQIVLKLFAPEEGGPLSLVRRFYEAMAGAIVDRVMERHS